MTQHLTDEQFINYINHTLTDAEREAMDRHLAVCRRCRAPLADHEALARRIQYDLAATLRTVQPSARMNFRAIAPHMKRSRRLIMFAKQSNQVMVGAVTLALLVALGLGLFMLMSNLSQPVSGPQVDLAAPVSEQVEAEKADEVAPAALTTATPEVQQEAKRQMDTGQITSQALAGNLIGDPATRRYWVYLPPGYDTGNKRYPVVYALHGFFYNSLTIAAPMGQALDELLASGEAREMIVVYPDGENRFRGGPYRNSPTLGDYESYIARDLVGLIDSTYRTLPQPESRGITGCGTTGVIHLAFKHPDVFSVAVPVSAEYDFDRGRMKAVALSSYQSEVDDLHSFDVLPYETQWYIGLAAALAPNPDKPPLYLDMPFEAVDGTSQVVPEVWAKIVAAGPVNEVHDYLAQPVRLRGLMLYQDKGDLFTPVEVTRDFDRLLTDLDIEHEYLEVDSGEERCTLDYSPVMQFMSDHLVFDE